MWMGRTLLSFSGRNIKQRFCLKTELLSTSEEVYLIKLEECLITSSAARSGECVHPNTLRQHLQVFDKGLSEEIWKVDAIPITIRKWYFHFRSAVVLFGHCSCDILWYSRCSLIYVMNAPDCFEFLVNNFQSPSEKSSRMEAQCDSTASKFNTLHIYVSVVAFCLAAVIHSICSKSFSYSASSKHLLPWS